jgi:outer membrane protein assembly factor BamB
VVDGILYVTGPNAAAAINGRTGRSLWKWSRPLPSDFVSIGFGHTNRGAAILDDKLFVATLDGYLIALDLKGGTERWSARVLDYKFGYSMTMAPLAIDGKVVVGVSGGEAGIRGLHRGVRCAHREAGLAILYYSRPANRAMKPGRATIGRPAAAQRGVTGRIRSGTQAGLLGHRQPGS